MINYMQTVASQYGNSPRMLSLLQSMNSSVDPVNDIDNFYSAIYDIDTANSYGLDLWGRIIGIGRVMSATAIAKYLGFEEGQTSANDYLSFGFGTLFTGNLQGSLTLADSAYRLLLKIKAISNIQGKSIPQINNMMTILFPNNKVWVSIPSKKVVKINSTTPFTQTEAALLLYSSTFFRPTGTEITL